MATHVSNLEIGLVVGLFGGVGSFFRGFRTYREYLRVEGTPEIPIRSVAMGLVRIHGKATGQQLVNSPISHTPCCFYQVRIEEWKDEEDNGKWSHYGAEADGVRFYLEDSSGRVLVDPRGAEYDIESTAVREASSASASSIAASGASDAELLGYVARVGPGAEAPGSRHDLEFERAFAAISKARTQATTPDELMQKLFPGVLEGEAKIRQALEAEGPQSDPSREELRLAQIDLHKHPYWSPEYAEGFKRVTKLQARVRKAGLRIATPPPLPNPPPLSDPPPPPDSRALPNPTTLDDIITSVDGRITARGRYRFTERCILPGHEYDITGTCGENPEARDASDRNLIRKGANEPTFLISGLAQPDVNAMLRIRAQLLILGGGMLTVFCLGFLLFRFGQF